MILSETKKRGRFDATVIVNRKICREHYLLTVRVDASQEFPATRPGQFIQIAGGPIDVADDQPEQEVSAGRWPTLHQPDLLEPLAFLRKPFSLAGHRATTAGAELDIIHRTVGLGTHWLSRLAVGARLDLLGPLGNAFELPAGKSIALLVGGGVGLPPMFYFAQAVAAAGWRGVGFVGAQTRDLLAVTFTDQSPLEDGSAVLSVAEWAEHGMPAVLCTDDGSCGLKGLITAGLARYIQNQTSEERARTVVYTCGPDRMMHAVAQLAESHGLECQVCLEQAMACGMSTCQSCIVKILEEKEPHARLPDGRGWRYRLACTDGPVFNSRQVVW